MSKVVHIALLVPESVGGYSVTFPDVPSAITQGDTLYEALAMAKEALELTLEDMIENGEALPEPRADAGDLCTIPGAITSAVAAELPSDLKRVNVSFERSLLERIDQAAEAEGRTRSGYLAEAARTVMRQNHQ